MMYSNRFAHSYRRQYGERSSRQWDDCDDRHEAHRGVPRDSSHKYVGNGSSSAERRNRSREYSDSPQRRYSKDTTSRDWTRKSPVRRRVCSPDRGAAEQKRRRFVHDGYDHDDDHRYRREPEDKSYRHSPDTFSRQPKDFKHTLQQKDDFKYKETSQDSRKKHEEVTYRQQHDSFSHQPKDFKHSLPQKDDFKYKETSQDSRNKHEEVTYRQQHDDYRPVSGLHKDRDHRERSWDLPEGRTRSQERSTNSFGKPRARDDSPSRGNEDHHHTRARFPLNEPCEQSFERDITNQTPTLPEEKSNEGFQRFLNVLNKGVNVAMLTEIVTRPSPEPNNRPQTPVSFTDTPQCLWSPGSIEKQQASNQNNCHWSESEGSRRLASPRSHHRSFSPVGQSLSEDTSLQRSDGGQSQHSRSRSSSVVEKKTMTPEDEHKHKQMQDVLQAIGLDLGSEELGQMSHRIQERLYGKRDGDHRGRCRAGSRERETSRRAFSPRYRSRSSSSNRSNFSSLTGDSCMKNDSCSAQRDVTELHPIQVLQTVDYVQNSSSNSVQEGEKCETNSQENPAAFQTFSHCNLYSVSQPPPPPPVPPPPLYSPVNYSPLPYSPLPPPLRLNLPPGTPFLPPYLPFPPVPPVSVFPAALPQTNHLLPPYVSSPQSNFLNLPQISQYNPVNAAQKPKPQSRPRCLQVIQTKQPG